MNLKEKVVLITEVKKPAYFNPCFSNEIYFSRVSSEESIKYTSNYCIKYAKSGSESYLIDNRLFEISDGQMLFIPEGKEVKTLHCTGDAVSVFLDNEILFDFAANIEHKQTLDQKVDQNSIEFEPIITVRPEGIKQILDSLAHQTLFKHAPILEEATYFSIADAMLQSMDMIKWDSARIDRIKPTTRWEILRRLELVYARIMDEFDQKNNLNELSSMACMSKYNLLKYFKMVYGLSPKQLQIKRRIEKGHQLLGEDNSLTVAQISEQLGYEEQSAFANQFKRLKGFSPSYINKY